MKIQHFADLHRLHFHIAADGTKFIPGRHGDISDWGDQLFGVTVMVDNGSSRRWSYLRAALLRASFHLVQNGDTEGSATFDPLNPIQSKLAIQFAGIKRIRHLSESERLRRQSRMRAFNRTKRITSSKPPTGRKPPDKPPNEEKG